MRHLETSSFEATLDVESFVRFAAVQYALVTAHFLGNVIQRLDDLQP